MSLDARHVHRRIIELQTEHGDLDAAIAKLAADLSTDEILLRRLKKRKLQIKDHIVSLQMQLVPDIEA